MRISPGNPFLPSLLSAGLFVLAGTVAMAATSQDVPTPSARDLAGRTTACTAHELAALSSYGERIADAESVEEAREMALRPSRMARKALGMATWVAPGTESFKEAGGDLERYEARIASAGSTEEVVRTYDELTAGNAGGEERPVLLADLQVGDAQVSGPGSCHYNTGEIIAVVIGFILFIIPGIILLIVLC